MSLLQNQKYSMWTGKKNKRPNFCSVQMLCSWFCSKDMGHWHLCFWFCRFGDRRNPCKRNRFHACFSFFLQLNNCWKTWKSRFLSIRLQLPMFCHFTVFTRSLDLMQPLAAMPRKHLQATLFLWRTPLAAGWGSADLYGFVRLCLWWDQSLKLALARPLQDLFDKISHGKRTLASLFHCLTPIGKLNIMGLVTCPCGSWGNKQKGHRDTFQNLLLTAYAWKIGE